MGGQVFTTLMVVFSCGVWGAPPQGELRKIFEQHYRESVEGSCGANILKFVEAIGDVENLYVIKVKNNGGSVFGMVNVETFRGLKRNRPANVERNFYHHIFLLDERGLVYDFDFTIEPRIVPFAEYLETMYLDETECGKRNQREFCVGRKKKLSDYELESYLATDYLAEREIPLRAVTMGQALKNWKLLTQAKPKR